MNENITKLFWNSAQAHPTRPAIQDPNSGEWIYRELLQAVDNFSTHLNKSGLVPGDRIVLLVQPSAELYGATISTLAAGMTVILIDPGIGLSSVLTTIKKVSAKAIITQKPYSLLLRAFPPLWRYKIISTSDFKRTARRAIGNPVAPPQGEAIISFTSGTTDQPKGANRTHELLFNQHRIIERYWENRDNSSDLTFFPVLGFHSLCVGSTLIIPSTKLKDPERAEKVLHQLSKQRVTRLAAPPGLMMEIAKKSSRNSSSLHLNSYLVGGTTVSPEVTRAMSNLMPSVKGLVVYGSTEVEPMAIAAAEEVSDSSGPGYLLGKPIPELRYNIRQIDHLIKFPSAQPGQAGELHVDGPHALKSYFIDSNRPTSADPPINTGDIVFETQDGDLWMLGRTADVLSNQNGLQVPNLLIERQITAKIGLDVAVVATEVGSIAILETNKSINATELATVGNEIAKRYALPIRWRVCTRLPRDRRQFSKVDRIALRQEWKSLDEVS